MAPRNTKYNYVNANTYKPKAAKARPAGVSKKTINGASKKSKKSFKDNTTVEPEMPEPTTKDSLIVESNIPKSIFKIETSHSEGPQADIESPAIIKAKNPKQKKPNKSTGTLKPRKSAVLKKNPSVKKKKSKGSLLMTINWKNFKKPAVWEKLCNSESIDTSAAPPVLTEKEADTGVAEPEEGRLTNVGETLIADAEAGGIWLFEYCMNCL